MAKDAIMIDQHKRRIPVSIEDVTPDDFTNRFICSGILDDGAMCGIEVRPSLDNALKNSYFYAARRDQPHKSGCPCARRRKTTIVERLDRRAKGKTNRALYQQLNRDKTIRPGGPGKKHPATEPGKELESDITSKATLDECKDIVQRDRMPRSLFEFYELLQMLSVTADYMDRKVFDLILDERTIPSYRRMGLPVGRPIVIVGRRTLPYKHIEHLENSQWLLIDYWATGKYKKYPIVFLLTVDTEAKNKLINLCRLEPSAKIIVYAVFHKHTTLQRTYVSEPVKPQMITALIDDESE